MQKIAVLGGGIGALATAAELTNDPDWQKNYDITIYQMGWRLGGKGASGRNRDISDRIQEHGIHLWMGFYENAFQMIRRIYDEAHQKNLMPQSPFTDARKAFSPMNFTPMMEQVGTDWKLWNLDWLPTSEFPGEESTFRAAATTPDAAWIREHPSGPRHRLSRRKEGQASRPGHPLSGRRRPSLRRRRLGASLPSAASRRASTLCFIASPPLPDCSPKTQRYTPAVNIQIANGSRTLTTAASNSCLST